MTRELQKYVNNVEKALAGSQGTFKEIYEIMFYMCEQNVLAETNDGYRIQKQTYGDIKHRIEMFSSGLRETIGGDGQYVGLELENCPEWIVAFWGILKSGNRPYLVNCRHPEELSNGILKSLEIKYVLAMEKGALEAEYLMIPNMEAIGTEMPLVSNDFFANEIALSTSATSLKEVVCFYSGLEIKNQLMNVKYVLDSCNLVATHYNGSLKLLAFLPFYHIFGLIAVLMWFTLFTRTLVFLNDYSGDTIFKTCRLHEVTHVFAVPMLWHEVERGIMRELAKYDEKTRKKFEKGTKTAEKLQNIAPVWGAKMSRKLLCDVTDKLFGPSVCFCISGGSFIRPSALKLINSLGYSLRNGYGMSEIGITSVDLRQKPRDINCASIGRPLPSAEYRIGGNGTLEVRGSSICKRMMIDGKLIEHGEWLDTGDVMEEKDGYYYIKGRIADTVISENGENINPDVIEERFVIPSVEKFSVLGLDAGDGVSKRLSMVIEISPYLSFAKKKQIMEYVYSVNSELPSADAITDFYFTENEIAPKTAVKVGRRYLLRAIENGTVKLNAFSDVKAEISASDGPDAFDMNSKLALKVRELIAESIGVEPEAVTADANVMLDLGGSSLEYFTLLKRLEDNFAIGSFDEKDKFCYTLREFTEYIEKNI